MFLIGVEDSFPWFTPLPPKKPTSRRTLQFSHTLKQVKLSRGVYHQNKCGRASLKWNILGGQCAALSNWESVSIQSRDRPEDSNQTDNKSLCIGHVGEAFVIRCRLQGWCCLLQPREPSTDLWLSDVIKMSISVNGEAPLTDSIDSGGDFFQLHSKVSSLMVGVTQTLYLYHAAYSAGDVKYDKYAVIWNEEAVCLRRAPRRKMSSSFFSVLQLVLMNVKYLTAFSTSGQNPTWDEDCRGWWKKTLFSGERFVGFLLTFLGLV